jgi:hypothetical protein
MADERRSSGSSQGRSGRDNTRGASSGQGRPAKSGSSSGKPSSGKPSSGKPSSGKPIERSGKPAGQRSGKPTERSGQPGERPSKPGERSGKPAYGDRSAKPSEKRAGKSDERSSKPAYGDRSGKAGSYASKPSDRPYKGRRTDDDRAPRREYRDSADRTADQRAYDGPDLPEDITGKELDRAVAAQLKGLPEKLASRVARHLAAAGHFIDTNPELAYQHALAAKSRAQRLAVVREALGEAAYAAGHYAEALAELRAAKRMNGAPAYLPIMADCHRALGQPEQAIKLAHSPSVKNFAPEAKAEMTIVEAGARRDLGQMDAALRTLEQAPLMSKNRSAWVVRLRYAYADTLEAAGRPTEALTWFHRTFAVDADELTDASDRAAALEAARGPE